jgi:hypothetical protein
MHRLGQIEAGMNDSGPPFSAYGPRRCAGGAGRDSAASLALSRGHSTTDEPHRSGAASALHSVRAGPREPWRRDHAPAVAIDDNGREVTFGAEARA